MRLHGVWGEGVTEITGSDTFFTNVNADYTATQWEACIDQAVDKINGYVGDDVLPNMTGAAGSKTLSVSSGEAGFIRDLAVAIYASAKNAGSTSSSLSMGALSESSSSSSGAGASQIDELAKAAAQLLKEVEADLG